ncbi:primosomal protein N' [Crocinitomicaceae bacterium CZZ-1]|uniref:Replication restart protein PriA n=1 Tax=Taishania pollutisoli TaxID=2766479 RepID=A0A8J6PA77_9FLAO|nr:primosomal protein N' [Taishania pollutisoli]MBC9810932.1 primosomal protein N' [Taishania pollutisoli]
MDERKTLFADVILPVPVHREFTYRVPFEMNTYIREGVRVVVPFGKSKFYTAIVTKVHETVPSYTAKYVEYILDEAPIITGNQYAFWKWIAKYYMAPIGDVLNAALPANFKLASETKIQLHPDFEKGMELAEKEETLVETLEIREELTLKELSEILGIKNVHPIIKRLIDKGIVITQEELNQKYTPKKESFVCINPVFTEEDLNNVLASLETTKSKASQLDGLLTILKLRLDTRQEYIAKKTVLEHGISASTLTTLEKNGYILIEKLEVSRLRALDPSETEIKELSEAQETAYREITESFEKHFVTLLFGVTGSGKTEIYVKLIKEQLERGKQVLFLLPEIALTTQLIQRLSVYFGEYIGVYHSKFNQNERVEIWNNVLADNPSKFRLIVGARSSVFLPFKNLGLIIVDEEHESSFKQYDPSPRYNARDAALVLAKLHNAKVLLGSATPAMETYFNAQSGKYGFVELTTRFGGVQLPEIQCADMRKARIQKSMQSDFSSFLIDEIRETLNKNKQIILFQNRRGYTPLWMCEICHWTPRCTNCDVSLTYHKQTNSLKCHYCSYVQPPVGTCAACGSHRIKMLGFGTEKIEDDLATIFPAAAIQRLDLDTTRNKHAYENILNDFGERKIDILIGTQMVSKGLDFKDVALVGILDADLMLNRSDFRAFERSFQLMSQVAGRAGRDHERGKVIIQTGDVDHWVIQKVHQHDYKSFYNAEIIERKNFFYPPFYKIINITLKHKDEQVVSSGAQQLATSLRSVFKERVLGPEFPVVRRIQNQFLKQIKLKIERHAPDSKIKDKISELIDTFYSHATHKSIRVVIDVDPA